MFADEGLIRIECTACDWPTHIPANHSTGVVCWRCGNVMSDSTCKKLLRLSHTNHSIAKTKRLISWLSFFRRPSDRGVGDTAARLLANAGGREVAPLLARLLKSCNCRTEDAAGNLNQRYPYS